MFDGYLSQSPLKRYISTEPLVDDDAKCVLVAGTRGMGLYLLRCHVCYGTCYVLWLFSIVGRGYSSNAKITEQNFVVLPQQYIFWFEVSVNHFLVVDIL